MSETKGFTNTIDAVVKASALDSQSKPERARPTVSAKEFDLTVESRRSVRVFDGEPVAPELMNRLIDLAMLAPSSSNLQPWEFHWVRSPQLKQELITACLSQPAAKTAGELLVVVARKATWRRNTKEMLRRFENLSDSVPNAVLQYYKGIVPKAMATGPLGLMAAIKWIFTRVVRYRQPMPQEPIGSNDVRVWAHKSVALAAQTFMLACRAHNLDSCPMEGFDSWRVRKILRLPKDAEISMIIGLGTAKPEGIYGDRLRFDRSWFVFEH